MKKNKNKKGMSAGEKVAIGAGVAAIGAGAYYLLGPKKKAHQRKAGALMKKIEKEAIKEYKKAKVASGPVYGKAKKAVKKTVKKTVKSLKKRA